jgi:hypothetical protein
MPLTPSMKLNTFTNPVIHAATSTTSTTSTIAGLARSLTSTTATKDAAHRLHDQPRPAVSPRRSSANPSKPKAATANAKTTAFDAPDHSGGHKQSSGDRDSPATGRRDGMGRPMTGHVDNGRPAQ